MPSIKDISQLPNDIKLRVEEAVSIAATEIHYSLQYTSPWWTGTFNKNWIVSSTAVEPTIPRDPYSATDEIPDPTERGAPKKYPYIPAPLGKSLYIGNQTEYAGFVINNPKAKMPNLTGKPVTYKKHSENFSITPRPAVFSWFKIYTKTGKGKFLMKDVTKGFRKAGFGITVSQNKEGVKTLY